MLRETAEKWIVICRLGLVACRQLLIAVFDQPGEKYYTQVTLFIHQSLIGLRAATRMSRVAQNMLLVPQLIWAPQEWDEDYSHLPEGFIMIDSGRWFPTEHV